MNKVLFFYKNPKDLLKLEVSLEPDFEVVGVRDDSFFESEDLNEKFEFIIISCMNDDVVGLNLIKSYSESEVKEKPPLIVYEVNLGHEAKMKLLQHRVSDIISFDDDPEKINLRFHINLRKQKFYKSENTVSIFKKGKFKINFEKMTIELRETKDKYTALELTPLEFRLLSFLIKNDKRAYSRKEIVDYLGAGEIVVSERSVDVHVSALRSKSLLLRKAIKTIYGLGYKFDLAA